jgi:hypothetical protein
LSLADCVSFMVMRECEIRRAFAFDRQFHQAGFVLVTESADRVEEPRGRYRLRRGRRAR